MQESNFIYHCDQKEHHGFIAVEGQKGQQRPAVLVVHDWSGRNDFACQKAIQLAQMGYVGFALDMYGQGRTGSNNEEKTALLEPLIKDRAILRARLFAAVEAIGARPDVDASRIAIIGFCFGGLCALDLARSGANIRGAVSFHGILNKPENLSPEVIKAKILVLHGYDDPMVKPEQVNHFCQEMNEAKADWQVHMYGLVQHSFTNPQAHDLELGLMFNETAARRSWLTMTQFLQEIFD